MGDSKPCLIKQPGTQKYGPRRLGRPSTKRQCQKDWDIASSEKRAGINPPEPNIGQLYKHMQRYRAGRLGMTSSYSCIKLRTSTSAHGCTGKGRRPGHGKATRWLVGGIGRLSGSQLVAGAGRARRQWSAQGAGKQAGRAQSTASRRRTARTFSRCKVKDMACPRRSVSIAASSPLRAARARPRTANTFWAVGPHPPPEPSATIGRNCKPCSAQS